MPVDFQANEWTPEKTAAVMEKKGDWLTIRQRRKFDIALLDRVISACEACLETGGDISLSIPASSTLILRDEFLAFIVRNDLLTVSFDVASKPNSASDGGSALLIASVCSCPILVCMNISGRMKEP